jgi:hypothetical protein
MGQAKRPKSRQVSRAEVGLPRQRLPENNKPREPGEDTKRPPRPGSPRCSATWIGRLAVVHRVGRCGRAWTRSHPARRSRDLGRLGRLSAGNGLSARSPTRPPDVAQRSCHRPAGRRTASRSSGTSDVSRGLVRAEGRKLRGFASAAGRERCIRDGVDRSAMALVCGGFARDRVNRVAAAALHISVKVSQLSAVLVGCSAPGGR